MRQRHSWKKLWWPIGPGGWVTVDYKDEHGHTNIMWTSHRTYHNASSPAKTIAISKNGVLVNYMTSALRFHLIWGYGIGGYPEYAEGLKFADWVHSRLCTKETYVR